MGGAVVTRASQYATAAAGAFGSSRAAYDKNAIFEVNDEITGQGHESMVKFNRLRLEGQDIQRFYRRFVVIDKDDSGEIELGEFYEATKLTASPFANRVFMILDEDKSGSINFEEFVVSVWNFCSLDNPMLINFAFKLFDLDGGGTLSWQEVAHLVSEVYGCRTFNQLEPRVLQVLKKLDEDGNGEVSRTEFENFNLRFPMMLFPAYQMQQELRRATFSESYWEKLSTRRRGFSGRSINIFEILEAEENARIKRDEEAEKARVARWGAKGAWGSGDDGGGSGAGSAGSGAAGTAGTRATGSIKDTANKGKSFRWRISSLSFRRSQGRQTLVTSSGEKEAKKKRKKSKHRHGGGHESAAGGTHHGTTASDLVQPFNYGHHSGDRRRSSHAHHRGHHHQHHSNHSPQTRGGNRRSRDTAFFHRLNQQNTTHTSSTPGNAWN